MSPGLPLRSPQAVEAVKARGKSAARTEDDAGCAGADPARVAGGRPGLLVRLPLVAAQAAEATVPMQAIRGRASFLGERSIGHMDPGARSASVMVAAACRVLGG